MRCKQEGFITPHDTNSYTKFLTKLLCHPHGRAFPDPAGTVRNISNCSLPPLAFNVFTMSSISVDGLPSRVFVVKCTRLCLNHIHLCIVFHPVAFSLALQLFLLFPAVLVLICGGHCCDLFLCYLFLLLLVLDIPSSSTLEDT